MADQQIRNLRALADIRRRRGRTLQNDLAQQRTALQRCLEESQGAREALDACITEHDLATAQRSRLLDQVFTPAHVRAADLAIETRLSGRADADKAIKRCESARDRQQNRVLDAQAMWRRNQDRIERFDVRISAALQKKQQEEDEAADEEAEESVAARIGARRKSVMASPDHE